MVMRRRLSRVSTGDLSPSNHMFPGGGGGGGRGGVGGGGGKERVKGRKKKKRKKEDRKRQQSIQTRKEEKRSEPLKSKINFNVLRSHSHPYPNHLMSVLRLQHHDFRDYTHHLCM